MTVHKTESHINGIERLAFDLGECSPEKGFAQVNTRQDASYYGTWANPTDRIIVNFAEGDIYVIRCDTDPEFIDEMRELQRWNDEFGWGPARIDAMLNTSIAQKFTNLGLGDMLHPDQLAPLDMITPETPVISNGLAAATMAAQTANRSEPTPSALTHETDRTTSSPAPEAATPVTIGDTTAATDTGL
ncbi:hypothetical protein ACL02S_23160 [Nocardia sp. 004]|uniref:hypothetical protein n=1 Tax=Nocardia sp. 004 TaxID=3385978 RepID=UPI0039A2D862